jgi:hypothetical protein
MMPAGSYYVGDLCYVMHPQWDEFCSLTISSSSVSDGEFELKNGVRFASLCTLYGDGFYEDQFGNGYSVDAGLIGCIRIEDIADKQASLNLGTIHEFEEDFEVYSENGMLHFGIIQINTAGSEEEEDDEYDDEED